MKKLNVRARGRDVKTTAKFFASCPRGLENLLTKELKDFAINKINVKKGGVQFEAEEYMALEFLVNTRIASRVFRKLYTFNIKDEKDLYKEASKQNWNKIFSLKQTFKISTLLDGSAKRYFKNSMILSQILKDAIVDQFRNAFDERPSVNTTDPEVSLLLRVENNIKLKTWQGIVLLDLCGEPLSSRGYRSPGHRAPLRENLAAAIVMSTDWNPEEDIFIDSMCGSGTILIEAVLQKAKIPPSYLKIRSLIETRQKPWNFLSHKWFKQKDDLQAKFETLATKIYNQTLDSLNELHFNQFYGYDISRGALEITKENLKNALIQDGIIVLEQVDSTTLNPEEEAPGIVVCNPPYGQRLGADSDLEELYHLYGENLKSNFKGYRAYVFTGNSDLRKKISLQTSKRVEMYNGNIECRLLKYELY